MGLQEQKTISLMLKSGESREAVSTGNNAAWLCLCGRGLPLIGTTLGPPREVECLDCHRLYGLIPEGIPGTKVLKVEELNK